LRTAILKERDMKKTHLPQLAGKKVRLSDYRETIEKYLPVVLVKCTKYTNSKQLAEIIAVFTFVSAYRFAEILDGCNMPRIIEGMVDIVGRDLADDPHKIINGQLLFEQTDALCAAKKLAEMDIKECLAHTNYMYSPFDRSQFERIIASVMNYLAKEGSKLKNFAVK
jgi:hypothetical protein